MANSPVVVIGISYRDHDANTAKITFYVPWSVVIADVWTVANNLVAAMDAISNAVLGQIDIVYRWRDFSPPDAPEESDVERKVLLLITNEDDEINGVIIPSPVEIWETTGSYAGIRVDLLHPAIVAFQEALEAQDYRTDDDHALGEIIATGGLAL